MAYQSHTNRFTVFIVWRRLYIIPGGKKLYTCLGVTFIGFRVRRGMCTRKSQLYTFLANDALGTGCLYRSCRVQRGMHVTGRKDCIHLGSLVWTPDPMSNKRFKVVLNPVFLRLTNLEIRADTVDCVSLVTYTKLSNMNPTNHIIDYVLFCT